MVYDKTEKSSLLININDMELDKKILTNETIVREDGTYIGEIKDGKRHGKGVMTYNKNAVDKNAIYEGEWKDDKRQGIGKITYEDGKIYEGDWKDDKRHGDGTMTYCDSSPYFGIKSTFGIWKNDKFYERKKTVLLTGKIYEGSFNLVKVNGTYMFV
jgi:hypothetical protein